MLIETIQLAKVGAFLRHSVVQLTIALHGPQQNVTIVPSLAEEICCMFCIFQLLNLNILSQFVLGITQGSKSGGMHMCTLLEAPAIPKQIEEGGPGPRLGVMLGG